MADVMDIMGLDDFEQENTAMDDINSETINLVCTLIDESGSMGGNIQEMNYNQSSFKDALANSKEADEMLVAKGTFSNSNVVIGGYKKIEEFDTTYKASGMTPLYDAIIIGAEKLVSYRTYLKDQGMNVKAVFAVFSDGEDTSSRNSLSEARRFVENLNSLEIPTAFIAFGNSAINEATNLKFKSILKIDSNTPDPASALRHAFDVLSKSTIKSVSVVGNNVSDDLFTM